RRIEPLEMLAAILAVVDAVIGAGQHGARLLRMDRKAEDAAFRPQTRPHLPPAIAAVRADPGTGADGADANREIAGHVFPPRPRYLVLVSHPVWEMSSTTPSGPAHFISKLRCPPAAISSWTPGFSSSRSPRACSNRVAASSRSSTSKPKWWMPL